MDHTHVGNGKKVGMYGMVEIVSHIKKTEGVKIYKDSTMYKDWITWKTLSIGGIGYIILGIIMLIIRFSLYSMPCASSTLWTAGMIMGAFGVFFLIIGTVMIVAGWIWRNKKRKEEEMHSVQN